MAPLKKCFIIRHFEVARLGISHTKYSRLLGRSSDVSCLVAAPMSSQTVSVEAACILGQNRDDHPAPYTTMSIPISGFLKFFISSHQSGKLDVF